MNDRPLVFRWPNEGGKSATGRDAQWAHGVYFPDTDLCISEMGARSTGKPVWSGIEWIDSEELHTMKLAAIMTASIQNTEESIKGRIGRDNPYWTVAYDDVCKAVDREMGLRREVEFLRLELKEARAEQVRLIKAEETSGAKNFIVKVVAYVATNVEVDVKADNEADAKLRAVDWARKHWKGAHATIEATETKEKP
jgi:hypothetical protein